MSVTPLNLQQLALDRSPRTPTRRAGRGRIVSRYVVPLVILCGFLTLFGASIGKQLAPRKKVTVFPVILKRSAAPAVGSVLFQAAGWVEPRPGAVKVTALAGGIIDELLVVEGQMLEKGDPVARLLTKDAELLVQQADAAVEASAADVQRATGDKKAALARLLNPTHLRAESADAASQLARASSELARLPSLIQAAEAQQRFAQLNMEGKLTAGNAVSGIILEQSRRDSTTATADLSELQSRLPHLEKEVAALQSRAEALDEQLRLLIDEQRSVDEATARLMSAEATERHALVQLERAKLNFERTTVRATMSGRVLRILASQGSRVIGMDETTGQNSANVIEMYDPNRLQVRADVRLEDVPMVQTGAPVEIETASAGKKIQGKVLGLTSSANIQKNTLEVKVELLDPPATVSPEMLVKATFQSSPSAAADDSPPKNPAEPEHLFVPTQLIQSDAAGSNVWVLLPDDTADFRQVTIGGKSGDDLTEIIAGLSITDKIIASGTAGLQQGDVVEWQTEELLTGTRR